MLGRFLKDALRSFRFVVAFSLVLLAIPANTKGEQFYATLSDVVLADGSTISGGFTMDIPQFTPFTLDSRTTFFGMQSTATLYGAVPPVYDQNPPFITLPNQTYNIGVTGTSFAELVYDASNTYGYYALFFELNDNGYGNRASLNINLPYPLLYAPSDPLPVGKYPLLTSSLAEYNVGVEGYSWLFSSSTQTTAATGFITITQGSSPPPPPRPTEVTWALPVNGNWSTSSKWTPATTPISTIDANFNTGSTSQYTVALTGASATKNLTVQGDNVTIQMAGNALNVGGSLIVSEAGGHNASLSVSGTGLAAPTVTVTGGVFVGTVSSTPTTAAMTVQGANLTGNVTNYGRLGVVHAGSINGDVTNSKSGQLYGDGTILGNVSNTGLITPGTGATPGVLAIGGEYSQLSSGNLGIRVNDSSTSGNFDTLAVTGAASLAGSLAVTTPGSKSAPGRLPSPTDTYSILATDATPSGKFNHNDSYVSTQYADGGAKSGVFHVSYDSNGVTLSNFHQIHVLSYGVQFVDGSVLGQTDANNIKASFDTLPGVVDNIAVTRSSADVGNPAALTDAIAQLGESVHPGDTCVFFVSSHGTDDPRTAGAETVSHRERPHSTVDTTSSTVLLLSDAINNSSTAFTDVLSGAQLASAFSDPKWDAVNKLFVIDACYAGGLWSGPGNTPMYLSKLDHSAILAAADEEHLAESLPADQNGHKAGEGFLSIALEEELAQISGKELTFENLVSDVKKRVQSDQIDSHNNNLGLIRDPDRFWGGVYPTEDNVWGAATSDFSLGIDAAASVPEPRTDALLVIVSLICSFGGLRHQWTR